MLQCAQLIQDTPECPYIWRIRIRLWLADLRRHIVRSTLHGHGDVHSVLEHFWNTEIAQFNCVISCQENVLRFEIAMQNFPLMNVLQRHANLQEPIHNFSLWEKLALRFHLLHMMSQVTHYIIWFKKWDLLSQNSMIIIRTSFSTKLHWYYTMFTWFKFLNNWASRRACSYSRGGNDPIITFFAMKYFWTSGGGFLCLTRKAAPKLPLPIHLSSSNSSS